MAKKRVTKKAKTIKSRRISKTRKSQTKSILGNRFTGNHILIGIFTAILLLTFARAATESGVWHTAEETRITIDGAEKSLQEAAELGDLAIIKIGETTKTVQKAYDDGDLGEKIPVELADGSTVEKTVRQAWIDGNFVQDLPEGLAVSKAGSGWYTCGSESCIAVCQGKKVSLSQGQSRFCGLQTWSAWSNRPYGGAGVRVAFGVNGWNINTCAGCTVSTYASEKSNWIGSCIPTSVQSSPNTCPASYSGGNWDRVTNYQCDRGGLTGCDFGYVRDYGKGWQYTPALSTITPAAWTATELSFPQPPVPSLKTASYSGTASSYAPLNCPTGQLKVYCTPYTPYQTIVEVANGCYPASYTWYPVTITCMYLTSN